MCYLCEKHYKHITVQYYIGDCWVARLALLELTNMLLECTCMQWVYRITHYHFHGKYIQTTFSSQCPLSWLPSSPNHLSNLTYMNFPSLKNGISSGM